MGLLGSLFAGGGAGEAARLYVSVQANVGQAAAGLAAMDRQVEASQARATGLSGAWKAAAAGLVGSLVLTSAAAISWESDFAGVEKTVAGTSEELAVLEGELRDMARTMPIAHGELAAVAEQAGALGVAKEDIEEFTRVASLIGITTDVSAGQAATSLGQLSNVLDLTQADYERFGSTLVDLGNKGASTESQILEIAAQSGAAANLIDFATHETLGWASAIANLGIEVEAGGSSLQRFFIESTKHVAEMSDELDIMAQTAGMSSEAFAAAFGEDSSAALQSFVAGLGELARAEQLAVIEALGFNDIRIERALLGLADGADMLASSLDVAAEAWDENTAMSAEAEKRFATTASQLQILWNNVMDLGITLGSMLLPAINAVVAGLTFVAQALAMVPPPVWLGIATAIGVGLVSALWAAIPLVWGFAAGVIAATWPLALLAGAVALLAWAFSTNFLAIRDVVGGVFDFITGLAGRVLGMFLEMAEVIVGVAAAIPGPWQESMQALQAELDRMHVAVDEWAGVTEGAADRAGTAVDGYASRFEAASGKVGAAMEALAGKGGELGRAFGGEWGDELTEGIALGTDAAAEEVKKTPGELASALRAELDDYQEALDELTNTAVNSVSDLRERQEIEGVLASQELTDALNSDSTRTRLLAVDLVNDLIADYGLLAPGAIAAGELVNPGLAEALFNNVGLAEDAAAEVNRRVGGTLDFGHLAYGWGAHGISRFSQGIWDNAWRAQSAALETATRVAGYLAFSAPPSIGPLHDIDEWGGHMLERYASSIRGGAGLAGSAMADVAQAVADNAFPSMGYAGFGVGSLGPDVMGWGGGHSSFNAPLVHIEHFEGTPENVDRLADQIADRLRLMA